MATKRSYGQYCSLARALDLVGERWTLLILRDLMAGPRRYKDLLADLEGMGTNLLARRLKELTAAGVLEPAELPPPHAARAYRLTAQGRDLEPALTALAAWGLPLLEGKRAGERWSPQWNALALKARFRPESARGFSGTLALDIDGYRHYIVVEDGELSVHEGEPALADAGLSADAATFLAVFVEGELDFASAAASGHLRPTGDLAAFNRWREFFLPEDGE